MKPSDLLKLKQAVFRHSNIEKWMWDDKHYNMPKFLAATIHDNLPDELEWVFLKACYASRYKIHDKKQISELVNYGLMREDGSIPRLIRKRFYYHACVYNDSFDDPNIHNWYEACKKIETDWLVAAPMKEST
jgi:hypothetical protein